MSVNVQPDWLCASDSLGVHRVLAGHCVFQFGWQKSVITEESRDKAAEHQWLVFLILVFLIPKLAEPEDRGMSTKRSRLVGTPALTLGP